MEIVGEPIPTNNETVEEQNTSMTPEEINNIVDNAGEYRQRNISKKEDCLHFRSVIYSEFDMIEANLAYDFGEESRKSYRWKSTDERTVMLAKFISNIWQAHPFNDGNTRTDMIFLQKYLNKLEIDHDNKIFENNFQYFRSQIRVLTVFVHVKDRHRLLQKGHLLLNILPKDFACL